MRRRTRLLVAVLIVAAVLSTVYAVTQAFRYEFRGTEWISAEDYNEMGSAITSGCEILDAKVEGGDTYLLVSYDFDHSSREYFGLSGEVAGHVGELQVGLAAGSPFLVVLIYKILGLVLGKGSKSN